MVALDDFRNRMQIASSRVIAESLPRVEDVTFRSPGQGGEIGEAAEPLIIIRDNGGNLSLLEHELRDEDGVGIAGLAPREVAAMAAIPVQQRPAEAILLKLHTATLNDEWRMTNDEGQMIRMKDDLFRPCHLAFLRPSCFVICIVLICRAMNSYTHPLSLGQATKLRVLLEQLGFEFSSKEYTLFFAQKNRLSVAVYEKGPKVLVQGRGVEEFVQFELEPKILGEAKLGYEEVHSAGNVRAALRRG
jgi:hypothetical protein